MDFKQSLKHTTESSIQLDGTIGQKVMELEEAGVEINKPKY